jgi:hypothetical protein
MNSGRFILSWAIITIITILSSWVFTSFGDNSLQEFKLLTVGSLFFSLFCLGLFYLSRTQTNRKQSGTFMGLFMISILVKFSGSILFLMAYKNKHDIIPSEVVLFFILIYVVYLVFETWFMMILGKKVD